MSANCTVTCNVNASEEIEIESTHAQIELLGISELEFELDIDASETVIFKVPDFSYGGDSYTVAVSSNEVGQSQSTSWTHSGNGCDSPVFDAEIDLEVDITATERGSNELSGGGIIRIRPKGRPDR